MKLSRLMNRTTVKHIKFTSHSTELANDGSPIMTFQLKRNITKVRGSQIFGDDPNHPLYYVCLNVSEVKIHSSSAEHIQIDLRKKNIWGKFVLDVSRKGNVWVVEKSFAQRVRELREERRSHGISSILNEYKDK